MVAFIKRLFSFDGLGISASVLCLIHCVTLPALMSVGSAAGSFWSHHWVVDGSLLALSLVSAVFTFVPEVKRDARKLIVLAIFLLGFIMLASGILFFHGSLILMGIGGIVIATAHVLNFYQNYTRGCVARS